MKMLLHCVATAAILATAGQLADAAEPADPKARSSVRAEQRAYLAELYADTEYALGIDAPTREKLLDLLVEQLADLDAYSPGNHEHPAGQLRMLADAEAKHLNALRELLGDEGFERLFAYRMTLAERRQVSLLDKRLDRANQLQPAQKERLIDLLSEQKLQAQDAADLSRLSLPPEPVSAEQMLQASRLLTVAANEETRRRMPEVHQRFARQAATFLTPAQLAVFEDVNAERMHSLQQWIEQARLRLGLDPAIPATPNVPPKPRPIH
jgi:hypothetical protein